MIKRMMWFGLGVTAAAVVVVKGRQLMHKATPAGLAETVGKQSTKVQSRVEAFLADVTDGMRERETELRDALGMAPVDADAAAPVAVRARAEA